MHHPVDQLRERRDLVDVELADLQARQNGRRAEAGQLIGQVEQQLNNAERDPAVLAALSLRISEVSSEINRDETALADLRREREGLEGQIFANNEQADKELQLLEKHLSHWLQGEHAFEVNPPQLKLEEMVGHHPPGPDIPEQAFQAAHVSDLVVPALVAAAMMSQVVTKAAQEAFEALKESVNRAKEVFQTYVKDDNTLFLQLQDLAQAQVEERAQLEDRIARQEERFESKHYDLNDAQKTELKEQLDKQIALMREEQQKRHAIERENLKKRDEPEKDR